jgi:ABC-type nickel/cobalt efflux system permease component RcnA
MPTLILHPSCASWCALTRSHARRAPVRSERCRCGGLPPRLYLRGGARLKKKRMLDSESERDSVEDESSVGTSSASSAEVDTVHIYICRTRTHTHTHMYACTHENAHAHRHARTLTRELTLTRTDMRAPSRANSRNSRSTYT